VAFSVVIAAAKVLMSNATTVKSAFIDEEAEITRHPDTCS
jgi:hypothetical protein